MKSHANLAQLGIEDFIHINLTHPKSTYIIRDVRFTIPIVSIRAPLAEHHLRGVSETGSPVRELPAANAERLQHQDAPGQAGRLFANWLRRPSEHIAADGEHPEHWPDANHRHLLRSELRPQAANSADNRWADHIVAHSGGMLNSVAPGHLTPSVILFPFFAEPRPMAGPEGCPQ